MPPKEHTLQKYCRITKYLEKIDRPLYQALDDLCLFGLFRTGGRGTTFLYPEDKSYRDAIINATYSNDPDVAIRMIKALVLTEYVDKPKTFERAEVANALGFKVEAESATEKSVKLKSGHSLAVDGDFKSIRAEDRSIVYILSGKGQLPLNGTRVERGEKKPGFGKRGEASGGGGDDASDIDVINAYVEKQYSSGLKCVYRAVMSMVYDFAAKSENTALKEKLKCRVCASARASYYNIVAPYGRTTTSGIADLIGEMGLADVTKLDQEGIAQLCVKQAAGYGASLANLVGVADSDSLDKRKAASDAILHKATNALEYKTAATAAYNGDTESLHKDLLTVYCHLSAFSEESDPNYYTNTFVTNMRDLYSGPDSFINVGNDAALIMSLYGNLLKSDAFLYVPGATKEQITAGGYADLVCAVPSPTDVNQHFTIQYNNTVVSKHGGGSGTYVGGLINSM